MAEWRYQSGFIFAAILLLGQPAPAAAQDKKVTVLAILATDRHDKVDPRIKCIADEVKKEEPALTGYKLLKMTTKSCSLGKKESFPLVEEEVTLVSLSPKMDKEGRVTLTVKAPLVGEITYSTIPGKFFPILTRYQTKDKSRLIVAVMVKSAECK